MGHSSGTMKALNDLPDLSIRKYRIVIVDSEPLVEQRVSVEDSWFSSIVNVGATVTA